MAPWLVGHHSDRHTWLRCHTLCHIRYVITLRRHSPYGRRTEYHLLAGHHSVMSHYPPFFRNWPTISKISQLLFSLHLIQTDERKRTKTFILLIKTSLGGNALCIFRGGARSTGRSWFCRASPPLLRGHGLVRGIKGYGSRCFRTAFIPWRPSVRFIYR